MNVWLTPKLEQLVNDKVKSGLYNSASEVVREALRLLKEQDALKATGWKSCAGRLRSVCSRRTGAR